MSHGMEGTVTLVQESRFQLTDGQGVSHLFVLSPHAGAEPGQLVPLGQRQARVRVAFKQAPGLLAKLATSITLLS